MRGIENISIKNIDNYIAKEGYVILDVRDEVSYNKRHIISAINIPYKSLERRKNELSKNVTYVIYCEHGGISILAARFLAHSGYSVINTLGGINMYPEQKI